MTPTQKLTVIKIAHTVIWLFFVCAIFYVVYSGVYDRITSLTWISIALVIGEGLILIIFRMFCPLTIMARKYSNSDRDNFDIYLPNWLAKCNKLIFTSIFLAGLILVIFRVYAKN